MNIKEALASGKPMSRDGVTWYVAENGKILEEKKKSELKISVSEIVQDWQVKTQTVELTRDQVKNAIDNFLIQITDIHKAIPDCSAVLTALGF